MFRMIGLILGAPLPEFVSFLHGASRLKKVLSESGSTVFYVKGHTKMSGLVILKLHFWNKQLSTSDQTITDENN